MIETGESYKFRNHLEATAVYEDQVVEHLITGALAYRRVLSEQPGRDDHVREAFERQLRAAAAIDHPGFQRVFFTETVHGHFCVLGELVEGENLEDLTRRRAFVDKQVWAGCAIDLVKLLQEFEQLGIAFDRLEPKTVVLRRGVPRVTTRFPFGHLEPGKEPENTWIRRLLEVRSGGVYLAEQTYPLAAGMRTLKNILYFMATGQSQRTVGKVIHDAKVQQQQTGKRPLSLLGLEQQLERIFLRLHGEEGTRPITTLDELNDALYPLAPDRKRPTGVPAVIRRAAAPPPVASPSPPESADSAPVSSPPVREETPLPVEPSMVAGTQADPPKPEPPPRSETPPPVPVEPKEPESSPEPAPEASGKEYSGPASIPMVGTGRERDDAEEDRSYLYPDRPSTASAKKEKKGAFAASREAFESGGSAKAWMIRLAVYGTGVIIIIVVVFALLSTVQNVSRTEPPGPPPVAVFAPLPDQITTRDVITLDGTPALEQSEAEELYFTWNVPELSSTQYRIRPNRSRGAAQPELHIFDPGTYTVELYVFDGSLRSETYSRQITVVSPR